MSAPFHTTRALTPTWSLCLVQLSWAEGRSQSSYGGRGSLVELLSKIPRAGTKAFSIRPKKPRIVPGAEGRGRTLSGVSRGKAPPLRSEPPDFKCFYLSLSSGKNKFQSRSMSLASGLRRRNRAPSSCSPLTRPCHVTVAPEPGLLNSASSLHTPLSQQPPHPCRRFWWLHDWAWDKVLGGQETGTRGPSLLRPSALSSPA